MTTPEITACVSAVGVELAGLMALYFKLKRSGATREQSIKDEVATQIRDLKNHQDVSVQRLNGMLSYVIHSFPSPAWLKVARQNGEGKTEFRMLEVNEAYASTYGIKRLDYLGKTDLEAGWPLDTAHKFQQHDLMVWASGEPTMFVEQVGPIPMRFRKIRVQTLDGKMVGILGYAIDCHDPENCPVYSQKHN